MNEYITKLVQEMIWKPKPLSDEEIFAIAIPTEIDGTDEEVLIFARAIEERHGIK